LLLLRKWRLVFSKIEATFEKIDALFFKNEATFGGQAVQYAVPVPLLYYRPHPFPPLEGRAAPAECLSQRMAAAAVVPT
jgi:hypothetical protein